MTDQVDSKNKLQHAFRVLFGTSIILFILFISITIGHKDGEKSAFITSIIFTIFFAFAAIYVVVSYYQFLQTTPFHEYANNNILLEFWKHLTKYESITLINSCINDGNKEDCAKSFTVMSPYLIFYIFLPIIFTYFGFIHYSTKELVQHKDNILIWSAILFYILYIILFTTVYLRNEKLTKPCGDIFESISFSLIYTIVSSLYYLPFILGLAILYAFFIMSFEYKHNLNKGSKCSQKNNSQNDNEDITIGPYLSSYSSIFASLPIILLIIRFIHGHLNQQPKNIDNCKMYLNIIFSNIFFNILLIILSFYLVHFILKGTNGTLDKLKGIRLAGFLAYLSLIIISYIVLIFIYDKSTTMENILNQYIITSNQFLCTEKP